MPNSIKAAKEILKAAAAEAAVSEEKSVKWDLGKRWDCMQSIEKQQQKLSKMGVHSILIMVAENPRKEPTRKISTTGGFADLIHNGQVGKAFALECLKFTPKWSNDVNYKEKRKRTHSQTTLEKSDVPVEENNMPVEESCANIETREIVPAANLQLQMESNTVGLMSNLQAQILSKPVAGPSKNGDSHIFTNYENSRVDSRMPQIGPNSRKSSTASSNTLMSNFQAQISSNTPVAGPSKNGDSHILTNYEDSCADFRMQEIVPSSRNGPTASSNTLMSNFQAQISSNTPVAGPSKNGDITNYENSRVDSRMQEIDLSSRNGVTPSSSPLMSNLQAQISSNTPVAGRSKNGDSHIFTNYEDSCADFQMQEMERFRQPNKTFTYRLNRQSKTEYIVGPVRSDPKATKGSKLKAFADYLTDHRPASASMYALVRDAIALLVGGQGSLDDIVGNLYESQFIRRTFGKTEMKPKLLELLSSYIMPKLFGEENCCVSARPISNGSSAKTVYTYKFQSCSKEDLEMIAESGKKTTLKKKTRVDRVRSHHLGLLPLSPPTTPSPLPTSPFPELPTRIMCGEPVISQLAAKIPTGEPSVSESAFSVPIAEPTVSQLTASIPTGEPSVSELLTSISNEDPVNIYLLGEEHIIDRSYRELSFLTPDESESTITTQWFSVPNHWSDAEFTKLALEAVQAVINNSNL